jgi:hypothetical protein
VFLAGGVVDQNVEPSEVLDDLVDGGLAEFRVRDVAGQQEHLAAMRLDGVGGLLGIALFHIEIPERYMRPLTRVHHRDRSTDTRIAASDQRHFVLQLVGW